MDDNLSNIIHLCKKQNSGAQKSLYELYKDQMYAICLRYIKETQDAEDVFIEAFYKILSKIEHFKGEGSFEGWMRRIMVNESLMHLRKKSNLRMVVEIPETDLADPAYDTYEAEYSYEDIEKILDQLPTGYRTVFNLFVFEDYKHREIAEMLGLSINTSKSQLILAKKKVLEILKKKDNLIHNIKLK
ncbi:MAG: sigma-70 family RNA polymerase sigma factor [Saprospiraceae bacterium]